MEVATSYTPIRRSFESGDNSGASKDTSSAESVEGLYLISARGLTGVGDDSIDWMYTVVLSIKLDDAPSASIWKKNVTRMVRGFISIVLLRCRNV